MIVPENIQIGLTSLVPRSNCLVERDGDTSNTTVVANAVAVVESHDVVEHLDVGVVAVGDDELHTIVASETLCQRVVHQTLQAVTSLGGDATLGREAAVVSAATRDHQLEVGVVEQVVDTCSDMLLCLDDGERWQQTVAFHQLIVDATGDEVPEQSQDQRVDVRSLRHVLHQLQAVAEEPLHTLTADLFVELVESRHLPLVHDLVDVPVGCHHDGDSLGLEVLATRGDLVVGRVVAQSLHDLDLSFEFHDSLAQVADVLTAFLGLTLLTDQTQQLVCVDAVVVGREIQLLDVATNGAYGHAELDGDFLRRELAPLLPKESKPFLFLFGHGFLHSLGYGSGTIQLLTVTQIERSKNIWAVVKI